MSKFFLTGPVSFLQKNSPLNGVISIPFISLCALNVMSGFRSIFIETAFFTTYIHSSRNETIAWYGSTIKTRDPILSPEYRVLAYLSPCVISFFINALRLMCTTKGLWKYFMKYPQFLLAPCFTPFLFEGYKSKELPNVYSIRIWKNGTILNAFYLGCIPPCVLVLMQYYRGIPSWFMSIPDHDFEHNDSLFGFPYFTIGFSVVTCVFYFILILLFFCTNLIFGKCGVHCKLLNILCCPCPQNCVTYDEPEANIISPKATIHKENRILRKRFEQESKLKL